MVGPSPTSAEPPSPLPPAAAGWRDGLQASALRHGALLDNRLGDRAPNALEIPGGKGPKLSPRGDRSAWMGSRSALDYPAIGRPGSKRPRSSSGQFPEGRGLGAIVRDPRPIGVPEALQFALPAPVGRSTFRDLFQEGFDASTALPATSDQRHARRERRDQPRACAIEREACPGLAVLMEAHLSADHRSRE
jgi:hypothetical protein